ncbi:MAG: rRNA maturation RNase YbeY [Ignavibacteriae bacterium]|nr:rRNA maturation RNase YbeY [Ignavibacteriota bacterium]MCB9216880.1 rRNA maturation RNase YbeY [Ignavibacteria bacterium]
MIQVDVVNAHPTTRLQHKPFQTSVQSVLKWGKVKQAQVTVIFVDDQELLRMNREFLNHNYFTDVITFPIEDDPLEGEIYISIDRAREQGRERSIPLYSEVSRLVIHGTLHLLGYDDGTATERQEMTRLEDQFLQKR